MKSIPSNRSQLIANSASKSNFGNNRMTILKNSLVDNKVNPDGQNSLLSNQLIGKRSGSNLIESRLTKVYSHSK